MRPTSTVSSSSALVLWFLLSLAAGEALAQGQAADNCSQALPIALGTTQGTLVGASSDGASTCGLTAGNPDVWYRFIASQTGVLAVSTCGTHDLGGVDTSMNTVLSLHTSCADPIGSELACNDNFPTSNPGLCAGIDFGLQRDSAVRLPITTGDDLLIRVSHASGSPLTIFRLTVDVEPLPVNNLSCSLDPVTSIADIDWTLSSSADQIDVFLDGSLEASLPGTATTFTTNALTAGGHDICVQAISNTLGPSAPTCCAVEVETPPIISLSCATNYATGEVELSWTNGTVYDELRIYQASNLIGVVPGSPTMAQVAPLVTPSQTVFLCVEGFTVAQGASDRVCCVVSLETTPVENVRCRNVPGTDVINVTWDLTGSYSLINVYVDGVFALNLLPQDTSYDLVTTAPPGTRFDICVQAESFFFGLADEACCFGVTSPPLPSVNFTHCRTPGLSIMGGTMTDTLNFPDNVAIQDLFVDVDISHPSLLGLNPVGLTSPAGTTITLHSGGGALTADLAATFWQLGFDNGTVPYAAGAVMKASGPGSLADFSCEPAQGDWELSITENMQEAATLNEWCVNVMEVLVSCCADPTQLTCDTDCTTSEVALNWINNGPYTAIDLYRDGVLLTTLPGTAEQFVDTSPPTGVRTYRLQPDCTPLFAECEVLVVANYNGETDIILQLEGLQSAGDLGMTDSGAALHTALTSAGVSVLTVALTPLDIYPCLGLAQRIWVLTGTHPSGYRLTPAEGDHLAALAASGIGIYFEGNDHWGFQHVPSLLDERDGIEPDIGPNIADGDDSFDSMRGADTGVASLDLSGFTMVPYAQDHFAIEFTDRLSITGTDPAAAPDLEITQAAVAWRNDAPGEPDYVTGVIARHVDGGVMISTSWEFGGFGGDQAALAVAYLGAISPGGLFVRGDCNDDGSSNLADAVFLLGSLFPTGPPPPRACDDACDANDDGSLNLADVITFLNALFGMPPVVLPPPLSCGPDFVATDPLDCASFSTCP